MDTSTKIIQDIFINQLEAFVFIENEKLLSFFNILLFKSILLTYCCEMITGLRKI